jgi:hypothetical protein
VLKAARISADSAQSLGLLSRYRRYFGVIAFILVAIPPVVGVFGGTRRRRSWRKDEIPPPRRRYGEMASIFPVDSMRISKTGLAFGRK